MRRAFSEAKNERLSHSCHLAPTRRFFIALPNLTFRSEKGIVANYFNNGEKMKEKEKIDKPYIWRVVRQAYLKKVNLLLKSAVGEIYREKPPHLYGLAAHLNLMKHGWDIVYPLLPGAWPEEYKGIHVGEDWAWPGDTVRFNVALWEERKIPVSHLYFGYVVVDDRLERCSFFTVNNKRKASFAEPDHLALDLLAWREERTPECYCGCPVDSASLRQYLLDGTDPWEYHVLRTRPKTTAALEKEMHLAAYSIQMQYEPDNFPPDLLEKAREYGLIIPSQRGEEQA